MTTLDRSVSIFPVALHPEVAALLRHGRRAALVLGAFGLLAVHVAHEARSPYGVLNAEVQAEAKWAARYDAAQLSCTAGKACPDAPTSYEN